jgi:epoxide hydrolase-like predicted phosphatase
MIQAICFDFGGVLLHPSRANTLQAWGTRLGIAPGRVENAIYGGVVGAQIMRGDISDDEVWALAARKFALSVGEVADFRADIIRCYTLNRDLVGWIYRLRAHYQIALISNAPRELRQVLHTLFPIADAFDLIVCSAEERLLKPDPEIYRRALTRLDCAPESAMFIDDKPENVLSAQSIGMQGILFRNNEELLRTWAIPGFSPILPALPRKVAVS